MNLHVSALGVFIFVTLVLLVVSTFAGFAGLVPTWAPGGGVGTAWAQSDRPTISNSEPNFFNTFGGIWDGVLFFFGLMTFSVPEIPDIFGGVWLLLCVMDVAAILVFIRTGN